MSTPQRPSDNPRLCIPWQTWKNLVKADTERLRAQTETATKPPPPAQWTPPAKARLPPGIVLDENGKPCKVCNSWQTWAKVAKKQVVGDKRGTTTGTGTGAVLGSAFGAAAVATSSTHNEPPTTLSAASAATDDGRPDDCPPDVNALGRATWTFLHTTAAYYPTHPTPAQQSSMRSLIAALGEFYPCTWCATDFRKRVQMVEPDVSGRAGLSRWFCERHNEVNEKLGKEVFDCAKVMERWKDGPPDGRCD